MNDYLLDLFTKYKKKGILVDTNVLLLFIVGSYDLQLIPKIARTSAFSIQDFQIVSKVIDFFDVRVTTPHVLTEVSNLIGRRNDLHIALRSYINIVEEKFSNSSSVALNKTFSQFGLADTAILHEAMSTHLVLTDDGALFGLLRNMEVDVVNLHILRSAVL